VPNPHPNWPWWARFLMLAAITAGVSAALVWGF
jgi:hypothetical protein